MSGLILPGGGVHKKNPFPNDMTSLDIGTFTVPKNAKTANIATGQTVEVLNLTGEGILDYLMIRPTSGLNEPILIVRVDGIGYQFQVPAGSNGYRDVIYPMNEAPHNGPVMFKNELVITVDNSVANAQTDLNYRYYLN
ncbi:MAG: hypothetical protein ABW094_00510 [Candidatus Thiodiazotropha sp.]